MSGYKLLLVPADRIMEITNSGGHCAAIADHTGELSVGPFEVIADVGEDKRIKMSRPVYDEIEVVEPPF